MRLFIARGKWNWVDDKDNFVGYSNERDCCEEFSYKYSRDNMGEEVLESPDISGFSWDFSFFFEDTDGCEGDYYSVARFRMSNMEGEVIYLTLINAHNGYYSHEFTSGDTEKAFHKGYL
jgi:hypothetical protein